MPLLADDKDSEAEEPYEFEEGQDNVAKLIHLVYHKTNHDLYFEILLKFKRIFVKGGIKRMKYTIPSLVFAILKLSQEMVKKMHSQQIEQQEEEKTTETDADELPLKLPKVDHNKLFKLIHELVQLIQQQYPDLSLRLYLQATEAINKIPSFQDLEELAYEFCS
jgi:vacuolar protein sorting-associated protein 35